MRTKKSKQLVREELKKILYKRMFTENTNPFKKGDSVIVVKVFGTTHAKQSDARRFTGKKGIINDIQGDYVFVNLKGFRSPSIEFHKNEIDWTDPINERVEGSFVITDKTKPGTYLQTYKKDGAGSSWTRDIKNAMVFGTHGSASSVIGDQVDKWQSRWRVEDINEGQGIPKQRGETLKHFGFEQESPTKWVKGKNHVEVGDKPGYLLYIDGKPQTDDSPFYKKNKRKDWNALRGDLKKLNENDIERFFKTTGKIIAKRVDVHQLIDLYSTDKDAAYDMLMNRLDTTPLGSKLQDDEKQKVIAYAMDELALTESEINISKDEMDKLHKSGKLKKKGHTIKHKVNEGVDDDVEIIYVKSPEGAKKLGYNDGDVFYMISYNKDEPALPPMITLRYGNHEKMTKIYDDETKFQKTLAKIRAMAIDGPVNEVFGSDIGVPTAGDQWNEVDEDTRAEWMRDLYGKNARQQRFSGIGDITPHLSKNFYSLPRPVQLDLYKIKLNENELPYNLGGNAKTVMIDMDTVIDVLTKEETDENVIALIGELPPGMLEHQVFNDKWIRFDTYYFENEDGREQGDEKLFRLLRQDLGLNDIEMQIVLDDYINKRKSTEQDAWFETHDSHTRDEEWSGPAGGADVPPKAVHQAAEQAGIAWDGDENFMDFSEKITGIRHIDTMSTELRLKLIDALKHAVPQTF